MPTATLGSSRAAHRVPTAAAATLVAAGIVLQVAYPLVHGPVRNRLTLLTVLVLFLAVPAHALSTRGPAWTARLLLVSIGVPAVAEAVGVATGIPFGSYRYADSLGPQLLGVPFLVPLAWAMLSYPCLLAGQRLAAGWRAAALGAVALTGWDLFLDPQLVADRHWRWLHPSPGLNGIPLTNLLGWLLVSAALVALLNRLPRVPSDDRVPAALLLWTYGSCVLANAAFFGRPGVALAGGLGMGLVVLPYARTGPLR